MQTSSAKMSAAEQTNGKAETAAAAAAGDSNSSSSSKPQPNPAFVQANGEPGPKDSDDQVFGIYFY